MPQAARFSCLVCVAERATQTQPGEERSSPMVARTYLDGRLPESYVVLHTAAGDSRSWVTKDAGVASDVLAVAGATGGGTCAAWVVSLPLTPVNWDRRRSLSVPWQPLKARPSNARPAIAINTRRHGRPCRTPLRHHHVRKARDTTRAGGGILFGTTTAWPIRLLAPPLCASVAATPEPEMAASDCQCAGAQLRG
jgi:hypothetical protein